VPPPPKKKWGAAKIKKIVY